MIFRRTTSWLWLFPIALSLGWCAAYLSWPFYPDHGIFAWVGEVILSGGAPYKDAYDAKGPLVHLVYALAHFLFGRTQWGPRLFDLIIILAGGAGLYQICRRLGYFRPAPWAGLLFLFWYGSTTYKHTGHPDGWAAAMSVFLVAALLKDAGRLKFRAAITCGIISGLLFLIKLPFVIYTLIVAVYALAYSPGRKKSSLVFLLISGACFGAVLSVAAAWLAWKGALTDFMEIQFVFNPKINVHFYQRTFLQTGYLIFKFFVISKGLALPLAAVGLVSLWNQQTKKALIILVWGLIALICVVVQNKLWFYHWHLILPPLSLVTVVGLTVSWRAVRVPGVSPGKTLLRQPLALLVFGLVSIMIFSAALNPIHQTARFAKRVAGLRTWASYYDDFGDQGKAATDMLPVKRRPII